MNTTLGQRIAMLRKQKNLTQDALADAMGVSAQAVSKWENDLSCPDIMILPKLANHLGVSVDELLTGNSGPETRLATPETAKPADQQLLRVFVQSGDGSKVRVNLPLKLVSAAMEMGMSMNMMNVGNTDAMSKIDFAQVLALANQGVVGKLVEIEDVGGDKVEVWVE